MATKSLKIILGLKCFVVLCLVPLVWSQELCESADDCITDYTQTNCDGNNLYFIPNSTVCSLCPACVSKAGFGGLCMTDEQCAPGLKCENSLCALDRTNCLSSIHRNNIVPIVNMPSCNPDGTWQPVQCKGDRLVGRCFCYSSTGSRIYGMAWAPDATDMTCACSRRRHDLETAGRTDVAFHCLENGNYEPLQCDSGLCWCADEKTGKATSVVLTENLVTQLPCYDSSKFGSQYFRLCESKEYAIAVMKNKLFVHGTTQVTFAQSKCDYDGTYGVYQFQDGNAYCSWKDASRIGNWQSAAGANLVNVNCNCARDTVYYAEAGKSMNQLCQGSGNYEPLQELSGYLYCVDSDGYPTTDLMEFGESLDCSVYN